MVMKTSAKSKAKSKQTASPKLTEKSQTQPSPKLSAKKEASHEASVATEKKSQHKIFVYIVGLIAALAGLLFGIDVGIISGARPFIAAEFHLSTGYQELIVSGVLYGAIAGTFLSGPMSLTFGRRNTLLISALIFIAGALLCGLAPNAIFLFCSRVFLGIAVGVASFASPLYLSEVAPKNVRGGLISTYQLMITIGILVAYLIDLTLSESESWRWMLGITAVPAFLLFLGVLTLPKSPRWLMLKGQEEHALNVLERIRPQHEVAQEAEEIKQSLSHSSSTSLWQAVSSKLFIKVLLLGIVLQFIQQFCGINVLIYYAPKIYELAGYNSHTEQMWGTALIGLVNMLTTFFAIIFVDKFGRRPILFGGLIIMGLSQLALSLLFHFGIVTQSDQFLVIAMMLTYIIGFAASLGPIMWILCAEIFPLQTRDIGLTGTTMANWIANAAIGSSALTMFDFLGSSGTFLTFGVICGLSLIFLFFFCPETKNISLEKIEQNLTEGKSLRHIGK
jgi:SP family galactose:H+ symporter-like MFS transporter